MISFRNLYLSIYRIHLMIQMKTLVNKPNSTNFITHSMLMHMVWKIQFITYIQTVSPFKILGNFCKTPLFLLLSYEIVFYNFWRIYSNNSGSAFGSHAALLDGLTSLQNHHSTLSKHSAFSTPNLSSRIGGFNVFYISLLKMGTVLISSVYS